mmetsp:Transcript_78663/g.163572  ORF Transcript_78663/g.163572 Transcript_78663/m.163572 type:complete len:117 (+) Transcript_78663:64-414(+)
MTNGICSSLSQSASRVQGRPALSSCSLAFFSSSAATATKAACDTFEGIGNSPSGLAHTLHRGLVIIHGSPSSSISALSRALGKFVEVSSHVVQGCDPCTSSSPFSQEPSSDFGILL